jgi:hypothetical protein
MLLERTVQDLNENVADYVAALVSTLDKVSISDWEDSKTKKLVVPAAMFGQVIHHGAS